jgi:hypothetical protein
MKKISVLLASVVISSQLLVASDHFGSKDVFRRVLSGQSVNHELILNYLRHECGLRVGGNFEENTLNYKISKVCELEKLLKRMNQLEVLLTRSFSPAELFTHFDFLGVASGNFFTTLKPADEEAYDNLVLWLSHYFLIDIYNEWLSDIFSEWFSYNDQAHMRAIPYFLSSVHERRPLLRGLKFLKFLKCPTGNKVCLEEKMEAQGSIFPFLDPGFGVIINRVWSSRSKSIQDFKIFYNSIALVRNSEKKILNLMGSRDFRKPYRDQLKSIEKLNDYFFNFVLFEELTKYYDASIEKSFFLKKERGMYDEKIIDIVRDIDSFYRAIKG